MRRFGTTIGILALLLGVLVTCGRGQTPIPPGAQVVHVDKMDRVEMDFDDPADPAVLDADLATLGTATDEALRALGIDVPACPR